MGESENQNSSVPGSGHLFTVRGDLTDIACDGWLLPSDANKTLRENWWPALERALQPTEIRREDSVDIEVSADFRIRIASAIESIETPLVCNELEGFSREGQGSPWLTNIAVDGIRGEDQADLGLIEFIRSVEEQKGTSGARLRLAIPAVGTGAGGWGKEKGSRILQQIRVILDEISREGAPDIILVLRDERMFAAAQFARKAVCEERGEHIWPQLGEEGRRLARELARKAIEDELVVFIGAGVSSAAGFPSWGGLLDELASDAGMKDSDVFGEMSPLDRAWLIEKNLTHSGGGTDGEELGQRVSRKFLRNLSPSLAHQLIASLPIREAVTTNYDLLFERAAESAGKPVELITDVAPKGGSRWLLKLHGSADRPEDIVLSRSDYLNYSSERAALAGVVQALLLTRHMLFVGFSLSDDNFLKIAHDVRNAVGRRSAGASPVGTALMVDPPEILSELWGDFIGIQSVDLAGEAGARGLEILLDAVLAHSVTRQMAYLFDESFDALLNDEDLIVRDALRSARASVGSANSSDAAALFHQFLYSLGWGSVGVPLSTQRVTQADLEAGRIRIPRGPSKLVFPPSKDQISIELRGQPLNCRWDPRFGPPERSGVIGVGKANLESVNPDEVLSIEVGDTTIRLR